MNDNLIIENLQYTEEIYINALAESSFKEDIIHGIGDESNGNS